jgi:hypothetical protein
MKIFKLSDNIEVVCESLGTNYGFRHIAHLMVNGNEIDKNKICYYNRTWECFEFESVLIRLIENSKRLDEFQKERFIKVIGGLR